jgi:DNA polymerase III delta prime subunit
VNIHDKNDSLKGREVKEMLKEKMPVAFSNGQNITLPFTASMSEPLYLLVEYEREQKDKVMAGIQSIILKLIRFMPAFSLNLTYIDPNDRGTNLGLLQKLAGSSADIFKKTYASKEDIARRLKELEGFVDRTSAELAGVDNVYKYNAASETKIPYQFIVINDYPDNFDNYAHESLQVLLKNSEKCGISFIFTSSNPQKNLSPKIKIAVKNNGSTVPLDGQVYNFDFDKAIPTCDAFIETVKTVYNEGIKVDNRFAAFFNLKDQATYMESTKCVSIPFAVDSGKHLVSLELGGTQSVNALLSGRTGSGKSTTLHMIISSIVMNYHPDDVELWLVDYKKVEFAEYIKCLPPHIRLLGLERNPEFTFSLLDKIDEEFQRRSELFKREGVKDITEYKKRFGVRKIPRIIFIIDEFHQMTQAIRNEPHYVQILENILSEYRAFGLSCVFSDQAISDGLRGLTEKGKKQISVRIAMENDISEVRETLSLDNSFYDESLKNKIQRMGPGDVIFKRSSDGGEFILDKYKTIFISREERTEAINRAVRLAAGNYTAKNVLIIDGQKRGKYEESTVSGFEKAAKFDLSRQVPVYVGTPVNLDPCFAFALRKKTESNIMTIGSDDEMRASILLHTIRSFKRQPDASVIVFAYKTDEIYRQYQKQLDELLGGTDSVITNFQAMCGQLDRLLTLLNPDNEKRMLICWLGLEEIADEFSVQPEKRRDSNKISAPVSSSANVVSMTSNIDALLAEISGAKPGKTTAPTSGAPPESLYDARPDIQELFAKGSRYNLYSFATFSSVKMIRQTNFVKPENFEHKIALKMSLDDSTAYLGRGAYASGLDNISAVYDDGSGKIRTFRPYIL